ncbi:MAG: cytochrome c [Acidobacteria bacterium]|nr:cytochrome c [Acidobacteriota bacterium]
MMRTILAAALAALVAAVGYGQETSAPQRTVWDGVYPLAQADRGDQAFADACASCHGGDMRGGPGVPGLVGPELLFSWNGRSAGALFEQIQQTMPLDQPGSLRAEQFAAIVAAIFRANGFPANGDTPLSSDRAALDGILITRTRP